ncbi:hypothetical protein AVEN_202167-1 [Araneus ventricosus]|uniref:Uncharacterized protein n=1 Tax=Araneus ventricosus TaxID=182803 RepID=A0A4Y2X9F1_ARAVE|nr:hypothetical protein AVEN_202167-1 [Araneus ventricosus]
MANSGSGGVVQCFVPLDRQTTIDLITSYGGASSHWCKKFPLAVLRTLLHAPRQLLGKSGTRPSCLLRRFISKDGAQIAKKDFLKGFGNLVVGNGKGLSQRFP